VYLIDNNGCTSVLQSFFLDVIASSNSCPAPLVSIEDLIQEQSGTVDLTDYLGATDADDDAVLVSVVNIDDSLTCSQL
jgi:hypothetical protein